MEDNASAPGGAPRGFRNDSESNMDTPPVLIIPGKKNMGGYASD
jgi:hypothetical protein